MISLKQIAQNNKTRLLQISVWGIVFILFTFVGFFIPEGFDWIHYFSKGSVHPIWTPWATIIIQFINWPLLVGVTCFSVIYRTYQKNQSILPIILAVFSLPTIWVLFMGNLDGFVILGIILMPLGIPLVTLKPQLSAFFLLSSKKSFYTGLIWGLATLAIWGLWPKNFLMALSPEWKLEWTQDISLFPWGAIIALPLFWLSRGDEDLLMAAGSFVTPHLFPYHFIILMPALARMKTVWMISTWIISWSPLLSNWIGPIGWHLGNVLGAFLWMGVFFSKKTLTSSRNKLSQI